MKSATTGALLVFVGTFATSCTLVSTAFCDIACAVSETQPEKTVFLPTYGFRAENMNEWTIHVDGWVFKHVNWSLQEFHRRHDLPKAEIADEAKNLKERAEFFLVEPKDGQVKTVRVGDASPCKVGPSTVGPSQDGGHLVGKVCIVVATTGNKDSRLPFYLDPYSDSSKPVGEVQLIEKSGVSVISDIDDTIKVSEVWNKEVLLANTFLRDFKDVYGMAEFYHGLQSKHQDIKFHYVSASPWPLYKPLKDLFDRKIFPWGTIHLKPFAWDDPREVFDLFFESPYEYKKKTIEPILQDFPQRTFILIGDSTEDDPKIYGYLANTYPNQIEAVYIRDVNYDTRRQKQMTLDRIKEDFPGLQKPRHKVCYRVFKDPKELATKSCINLQ